MSDNTVGITTANLNVRTGPSTSYSTIVTLPKGTTVNIIDENENGWYKIEYDKIYPFISSKYVNIQTNKTSSKYLNCVEQNGTIDGKNYVCILKQCKVTAYGGDGSSSCKIPLSLGKTCGSFNLPYGTKIYVPSLEGLKIKDGNGKTVTCDGIFVVNDTGIGCTDFDIYMSTYSDYDAERSFGGTRREDVYILNYGNGYGNALSYSQSYEYAYKRNNLQFYKTAFKDYIKFGGTLINFIKFKDNDKNIRNSKYWNILNS